MAFRSRQLALARHLRIFSSFTRRSVQPFHGRSATEDSGAAAETPRGQSIGSGRRLIREHISSSLNIDAEKNPEDNFAAGFAKDNGMEIISDANIMERWAANLRLKHQKVALVPTMGALHRGHLALIEAAAAQNDEVIVSIYVNPTQFGVNEDFGSYPRTFQTDLQQLADFNARAKNTQGKVTTVFCPSTKTMYPNLPPSSEIDGHGSFVTITPLGSILEGATRPVFFRGVATICMKLFNIVRPHTVYFGQKDIQQTAIIKRLVSDFFLSPIVKIVPTERHEDGLAMSSRNAYLGTRRRAVASVLSQALMKAKANYMNGKRSRNDIVEPALEHIRGVQTAQERLPPSQRVRIELVYMSLADRDSMEEINKVNAERGAVVSAAMRMLPIEDPHPEEDTGASGGRDMPVRLIDNIILPAQMRSR